MGLKSLKIFCWRGCAGNDQTLLSKFESLLDEKGEEVAFWRQNGISIYSMV